MNDRPRCSFCGKSQAEVRRLFTGPRALICNECVAILAAMLTDEDRAGGAPPPTPEPKVVKIAWDKLPHHQTHGPR